MRNPTVLTITGRSEWLAGMRPVLHEMGRRRLIVADSLGEAARLLEVATPHLIVIHEPGGAFAYDQLDELLWANSVQPRPAPVMVVVDSYSTEQATVLFQMGVDEYVSAIEHGDRLGSLLSSLLDQVGVTRTPYQLIDASTLRAPVFRPSVAVSLS